MSNTINNNKNETSTTVDTNLETATPDNYQVVLLNDDYTTMEFVIEVLVGIFKLPPENAIKLTMQIHKNGKGVAGIYDKELAYLKKQQVDAFSEEMEHPLRCVVESVGLNNSNNKNKISKP